MQRRDPPPLAVDSLLLLLRFNRKRTHNVNGCLFYCTFRHLFSLNDECGDGPKQLLEFSFRALMAGKRRK